MTSDSSVQAEQHVQSLVSTTPGERAMLPAYGVDLSGGLFGANPAMIANQVITNTKNALQVWEPGINVLGVSPVTNQNDPITGIVSVNVNYTVNAGAPVNQSQIQTATILVGGTMVIGAS